MLIFLENLKWLFRKILWKHHPFLWNILSSYEVLQRNEFYDVEVFDSKMTVQESVFITYLFWIEKNVANLFILICFKSTKVYCTIVKESSNSSR